MRYKLLKLKEREKVQIINALRAGVVPTLGLKHIQVGRLQELNAIVKDLDQISLGGSTIRFVAGEFGAGKSFFLTLTKLMAHEKKLLVMHADITTDQILCSSDGKTRRLLTELIKNMSYKSKPEGGALKSVIESWISIFLETNPHPTENAFLKSLEPMSHLPLYSTFAKVLFKYLEAFNSDDVATMDKCLKWCRAEYINKTEAKSELGVNQIIDDGDFYNALKLYAIFAKLSGFDGLLVSIDELAVLVRQRAPQRSKNYEVLLTIVNDCLQASSNNSIGFVFGATSESLENKDRGLYSYGALETRLASNRYANGAIRDLTGPVLSLVSLTKEEIFVLLTRLRNIFYSGNAENFILPDEGIKAFFEQVFSRMGAASHMNPRDIIKEFLGLLAVLDLDKSLNWTDLVSKVQVAINPVDETGLVNLQED